VGKGTGEEMTQDEIIEMARRAGVRDDENIFEFSQYKYLERFAKLVAAKEREACLKICEAQASTNYWEGADVCAEAIRARGKA
jgi:hypothetical protein